MGKKQAKKISGAERTAAKTERKAEKKSKKKLAQEGEEDIEELIREFQEKDRLKLQVTEEPCGPPSARCNLSFNAHPERDELLLFGGEFFNGSKTFVYNELYLYKIKLNKWFLVSIPNCPPPRCAHQAVTLPSSGGELWVFGGEFSSPTGQQFYHYRDLWCLNIPERAWRPVKVQGGPSARSGHRMTSVKKSLLLFGGFHDNIRNYRYYNDVWLFDTDALQWTELAPSGAAPAPRSGCLLAATAQPGALICGGYSKTTVKKDVDKGETHVDMFTLCMEKPRDDTVTSLAASRWRWQPTKQTGARPSPRCGAALVATANNRAVVFGGVHDEEEDEESLEGVFFSDLYELETERGRWHSVQLSGTKDTERKRRRAKQDTTQDVAADETADDVTEPEDQAAQVITDGVFTVTIGAAGAAPADPAEAGDVTQQAVPRAPGPSARMGAALTVKAGRLYLYGGSYEQGDRQVTLADMYSLDLAKLDQWMTLVAPAEEQEWEDTDSSSASSGSDDEHKHDLPEDAVPSPEESFTDFFSRTRDHWLQCADDDVTKQGFAVSGKELKTRARELAEKVYNDQR